MNDYQRIALVIRYLDAHHVEQPDLAILARHAGLSPFHFHRLFSAWAGVTPKDFLQCLTFAHARKLLREGNNVLDAALRAGLSGPGRLHDLCIGLEAASPGELKSGGASWTISFGIAESPFGLCLLAQGPRGVCHLSFLESVDGAAEITALHGDWPQARLHRDDAAATCLADQVFARSVSLHTRPALRAFVRGTPFQVRVWRSLLRVPPGAFVSYGQLAVAMGNPRAARAVGTAVARNPLAFLVPCHRVICETGVIGDYRWGATRKRAIVAWECSSYSASSCY